MIKKNSGTIRLHSEAIIHRITEATYISYIYNGIELFKTKKCDILKNEKGYQGEETKKIEIGGYALTIIPNGFVCIYGSLDDINRVIQKFNPKDPRVVKAMPYKMNMNLSELTSQPLAKKGVMRIDFLRENCEFISEFYILLIQEGMDCITIPGGKRFLGESSFECAKREFEEETGIPLNIVDTDKIVRYPCTTSKAIYHVIHASNLRLNF